VFTWGWASAPTTARGGYVRVWQRGRAGWRLIVDLVQAAPRPVASQASP
jgi:hypothetical protein